MKGNVLAQRLAAWLAMTTFISILVIVGTFSMVMVGFGAIELLFDTVQTWAEIADAGWFIARVGLLTVWFVWGLVSATGIFDRDFLGILDDCWEGLADWRNIKW